MRLVVFLLLVLLPCSGACGSATPAKRRLSENAGRLAEEGLAPRFSDRRAFESYVREGRSSPFGLDYVFVHSPGARDRELVDRLCETVGIRWVNFAMVQWSKIERRAPRQGRHSYDWYEVDEAVRAWQRNGIHIMMSLRFRSPWATAPNRGQEFVYLKGITKQLILKSTDYLPKRAHMRHFRDYMHDLVERYDGDGVDDMPGLLFPILHYQIGNEYYNEVYWAGTVEEYGVFLREAAAAARKASEQVQIVLSGIGFEEIYGFYDEEPDPLSRAFIQRNLPKVPRDMRKYLKKSEAFSRASAGFCDAYDILDARWPNYGIVVKSRELLREVGCPEKEIWSAEIYSGFPLMEPMVLSNWTLQAWPTPSRSEEYLKILKKPSHRSFPEVNAWYRGLHAAQVVKTSMVALDAGSKRLMMGWPVDAQKLIAVSTLSHHGLYSATLEKFWPAAHTYDLLITKLDGLQSIRRLTMPADVYVYEVTREGRGKVLVAFHDDHVGQNHDQPTGEVTATILLQGDQAELTHIVTEIGRREPEVERVRIESGALELKLTEYPVFIEAL